MMHWVRIAIRCLADCEQYVRDLCTYRNHVATQRYLTVSKTAFGPEFAEVARACNVTELRFRVVGYEEVVAGVLAEALSAVPSHVLDHHESAVVQEDEVKHAVAYNGAFILLNHAGENAEARWRGVAVFQDAVAALVPILHWSVDGFLHVRTVEVNLGACGQIVERSREPCVCRLVSALVLSTLEDLPSTSQSKGQVVAIC